MTVIPFIHSVALSNNATVYPSASAPNIISSILLLLLLCLYFSQISHRVAGGGPDGAEGHVEAVVGQAEVVGVEVDEHGLELGVGRDELRPVRVQPTHEHRHLVPQRTGNDQEIGDVLVLYLVNRTGKYR